MYFVNVIKELASKNDLIIFVDMDGVITDYNFMGELNFKNKRPLYTNIKTLQEVSKLENVTMCILSICKKNCQIVEKNNWLNKYAPFFKKNYRYIISKESNSNKNSKTLKVDFIKEYNNDNKKVVVIDDDNDILKEMKKNLKDIILFQDSSLLD